MNSCPIRWASDMDASVVATHVVVDTAVTVGAPDVGLGEAVHAAAVPEIAAGVAG